MIGAKTAMVCADTAMVCADTAMVGADTATVGADTTMLDSNTARVGADPNGFSSPPPAPNRARSRWSFAAVAVVCKRVKIGRTLQLGMGGAVTMALTVMVAAAGRKAMRM
jgi:hypothetical protein